MALDAHPMAFNILTEHSDAPGDVGRFPLRPPTA
jgi:hypothetical protein